MISQNPQLPGKRNRRTHYRRRIFFFVFVRVGEEALVYLVRIEAG